MRLLEQSIFWEVFFGRRCRRSDLVKSLQVSAPTVSRSADALIERGLLIETASGAVRRGRRPALLSVNPQVGRFGGIEMDRNRVASAITDMGGNLLGRGTAACNLAGPREAVIDACETTLREALEDADLTPDDLHGIGIGCAAWARGETWRTSPLASVLEREFGKPVVVDDRARAAALGHHLLGPDYWTHGNAVYVYAGTGIGAGLFINGRLYRGFNLAAGEIGHIVIDRNGPLCSCGRRGCVEAFASIDAVLARFQGMAASAAPSPVRSMASITLDQLVDRARAAEPRACRVLEEAAEALATGVANLVQILNPSLVVFTGSFVHRAGPLLMEPVIRVLTTKLLPSTAKRLKICAAPFKKDIIPAGCALLGACHIGPALIRERLP